MRAPAFARRAALAAMLAAPAAVAARAQSLTVLPVSIRLAPGEATSALTVMNTGVAETAVQARVYAWSQPNGADALAASDDVVASPPLATIPPGGSQVVRLLLRRRPQDREATYRILLDQIPAAAAPGVVRMALRLSLPIFAEPPGRAAPRLQFRLERGPGGLALVATNDGLSHEALRGLAVKTAQGEPVAMEPGGSPYLLAGAAHRWRLTPARPLAPGGSLRLTAMSLNGALDLPLVAQ